MHSLFLTIHTLQSISSMTVTLSLFIIFNTFPEPGDHPDMDNILSRFLTANVLEELPYVEGYCGEFCEGITQQVGPRWITSPFIFFLFKFLPFLFIYIRHFLGQQWSPTWPTQHSWPWGQCPPSWHHYSPTYTPAFIFCIRPYSMPCTGYTFNYNMPRNEIYHWYNVWVL